MQILIVDDEPDLLDVIRETLISDGIFEETDILTAVNGVEAFAVFEKARPPILMTDLMMPKMNGSELIKLVRALSQDTEIVVMTGHGDFNTAISLFQHKVVEFLRKPFNISEISIFARKVKETVRLRMENEAFKNKLIQAEKLSSVGLLAAGIAHEINNPNTFVKGNLELIQKYIKILAPALDELARRPGPDQARLRMAIENLPSSVEAALGGADRIRKIVAAFLALGRTANPEKAEVKVQKILEEALNLTHYRVKQHDLSMDVPLELPPLFVNEQEILQVLMNLIINAIDAVEERDPKREKGRISIRAALTSDGGALEVHVRDNGAGIPESSQKKIFDPFYTTKPVGRGTGLGLSISKGLVESNGGQITYVTRIGEGTTFVVRLPLKEAAAAAS